MCPIYHDPQTSKQKKHRFLHTYTTIFKRSSILNHSQMKFQELLSTIMSTILWASKTKTSMEKFIDDLSHVNKTVTNLNGKHHVLST